MSTTTFYRRQFLNTEEYGGTAVVEATIGEVDSNNNVDATFRVGDCSRIVEIDFCVYSDEGAENAIIKIARLRRAVVAFEASLLSALKGRKA